MFMQVRDVMGEKLTPDFLEGPLEPQYLVDAASAQPTTVQCLVNGLQTVPKRQVSAQVGSRDLGVRQPATSSQASALPVPCKKAFNCVIEASPKTSIPSTNFASPA
jgi:hypothetical protein